MRWNMKAERARKGMSAREVADSIGVKPNQIFRWESGEQEPSGSNLLKLSKLYECSPEYLLDVTSDRFAQAICTTRDKDA